MAAGHQARAPRGGRSRALSTAVVGAVLLAGSMLQLLVLAGPAAACSCAQAPEDPANLARADVVFVATLEARTEPLRGEVWSSATPATYVFEVSQVLKGEATARQEVLSASSGASCGLEIHGPGPFLVLATRGGDGLVEPGDGQLAANLCSGTRAVGGAELAELEQRMGSSDPLVGGSTGDGGSGDGGASPGAPSLLIAGAALTLAALVTTGLLLVRRSLPPASST